MAVFSLSDKPETLYLREIKGRDGMNVFETIGANDLKAFGMFLLRDKNGQMVDHIKKEHRADGINAVVEGIFDKWLREGTGQTYQHLIKCLKQAGMGAFAAEMHDMASKEKDRPQASSSDTHHSRSVATDDGNGDDDTTVSIAETPLFKLTGEFKKDTKPQSSPSDHEESKRQAVKEFTTKVRVVIQTCNDAEYYAALEKLKPPRIEEFTKPVKYPHPELKIVVGTFADIDAAIIKTDQGSDCIKELQTVFKDNAIFTSAKLLLGLGVCYGLKKNYAKHDLKFADVLVGREIGALPRPKFTGGTIETRGIPKPTPKIVQNLFCEDADTWNEFVVCKKPSKRIAKAFIGRLASGSILIDDPGVLQGLEDPALRYLGGEMEGWAQIEYTPEHVKSIIIKGIADFGDGAKDKIWQFTAAKAAVDYAHYMLTENGGIL